MILHNNRNILESYKQEINNFLKNNLKIELHNEKSKIMKLKQGINFLGFRNFYYYRILKKNKRKIIKNKLNLILRECRETDDYERLRQRFESILTHLEFCNGFNLRKKIVKNLAKDL